MTPTEFLALPDREKDASRYVLKCCAHCKKQFFALRRYVARGQMKHCSVACGQKASRRVHAIFHKGERFTLDKYGYYASSRGPRKKLHRLVWEVEHGAIPTGFIVHHKNGVKTDNRISNLELMRWAAHTTEHNRIRWSGGMKIGKPPPGQCLSPSCERKSKAKGLCTMHYQRMQKEKRGYWPWRSSV